LSPRFGCSTEKRVPEANFLSGLSHP